MLPKVQIFAIEGFDAAIIGTAYRGGNEVLVYDGYVASVIAVQLEPKSSSLEEYLAKIELNKLGDQAPVFVFLDEITIGDATDSIRDPGTPVH
ncbi:MAG: hypothetical protein EBZ91_02285 [Gammaproteobacteria bacterium]|jgi:hypothetical protein|nr:hypothetical protein [Gammaproteobacteria bacterium]